MSDLSVVELKKLVISAYDRIADNYTNAYAENDEQDSKYLDLFVDNLSGGKVLDMGCGSGINTSHLAQMGLDVIGIDASQNMLNAARKLYPEIRFEARDILQSSFNENAFDGIVLAYVINHFNSEGLVLLKNEIDKLLKENGLLFISAHIGTTEEIVPDPLDDSIRIYYNFLTIDVLDNLFSGYRREHYFTRVSYGEDEFLCDKMFVIYRKREN